MAKRPSCSTAAPITLSPLNGTSEHSKKRMFQLRVHGRHECTAPESTKRPQDNNMIISDGDSGPA